MVLQKETSSRRLLWTWKLPQCRVKKLFQIWFCIPVSDRMWPCSCDTRSSTRGMCKNPFDVYSRREEVCYFCNYLIWMLTSCLIKQTQDPLFPRQKVSVLHNNLDQIEIWSIGEYCGTPSGLTSVLKIANRELLLKTELHARVWKSSTFWAMRLFRESRARVGMLFWRITISILILGGKLSLFLCYWSNARGNSLV